MKRLGVSVRREPDRERHDHAMDEIRYFAATIVGREGEKSGVFAGSVERRAF